jgi:hypothetical protein
MQELIPTAPQHERDEERDCVRLMSRGSQGLGIKGYQQKGDVASLYTSMWKEIGSAMIIFYFNNINFMWLDCNQICCAKSKFDSNYTVVPRHF